MHRSGIELRNHQRRGCPNSPHSGRPHPRHRQGEMPRDLSQSETPSICRTISRREPGGPVLALGAVARAALGSLRTESRDERAREVRQTHCTDEGSEQCSVGWEGTRRWTTRRAKSGGGAGGKASGREEPATANMLRAQGRERVQRALERVRRAAQLDKKGRFTALLHHVYHIAARYGRRTIGLSRKPHRERIG